MFDDEGGGRSITAGSGLFCEETERSESVYHRPPALKKNVNAPFFTRFPRSPKLRRNIFFMVMTGNLTR